MEPERLSTRTNARSTGTLDRLRRLGALVEAFDHDVLEPLSLDTSEYDVLRALDELGPGASLKPSQLYGALGRSSGGMTKILKRLEAAGLVESAPDPEDGRGRRIGLSTRGRSLAERARRTRDAATDRLLGALRRGEREDLENGVETLVTAFESIARSRSGASS